jgi:hypothetical protein
MARGWESKSVEAQQEDATQSRDVGKPQMTREEADHARELANLRLSLKSVVDQLQNNMNPRHRSMLEQAENDLQRKIEACEAQRSHHQTG